MKSHSGQVAIYLIAVLVAICVLAVMNVSIYLAVSEKNKAMNTGDAAALAVANYQGELLNRIGQMNIDHLKAALEDDADRCAQIMEQQLRCCFLGPISGAAGGNMQYPYGGISAGDKLAQANGATPIDPDFEDIRQWLRDHAREIREKYATNPESYPAPWEGAWEEYAQAIELAVGDRDGSLFALPCNINFIDAAGGHILLDQQFYNAVAGRCWCWFHFNAPGLLGTYGGVQSWDPLPYSDLETRMRRCVNSEIYSLDLCTRVGSAVDLLGTNLIIRLTGATEDDIAKSSVIADASQEWMFYDEASWRNWQEIALPFPVVGPVRPEYDVRGCAALCWARGWTAAAKPFGSVESEEGGLDVVTAHRNFVTPAFTQSCLVPIDTVGGMELHTESAEWLNHIRLHLPIYLQDGVSAIKKKDCFFCRQLVTWERSSFRKAGSRWLKYNSSSCTRDTSGYYINSGGTPHGH